ncbi:uncharacterized protein Z519_07155 [Cladophialophora bantiana CBS 173.52]|uniref:Uncharacterized protein n=1 Tax=Cladophialophora bantiana (strain ATCC 10958 / CBS 173.52 / CDC B-1940 / NIH 8579) TaxID=1442370 RepID=A0A0D2EQE3_CLAB1|nr:uncharacterized protein Z519_07155 [Cladophialophora bantiana CBS 173.52]KIW92171.1 hypothetical protein Z519_07155 [Cladophialophora bantiana CBS 173.52]
MVSRSQRAIPSPDSKAVQIALYCMPDDWELWELRHKSKNGDLEEKLGKLIDLVDYAEGGEWVEMLECHRCPKSYLKTHFPLISSGVRDTPVVDCAEISIPPGSGPVVWDLEETLTRKILNVQEFDDLEHVGPDSVDIDLKAALDTALGAALE